MLSTFRVFWMIEKCRVCERDAVVVMILDDGARIPYCRKHTPLDFEEREINEDFLAALRKLLD